MPPIVSVMSSSFISCTSFFTFLKRQINKSVLSIYLFVHLIICISICLYTCPLIYLSIHCSICQFVCLSICLSVCLSICLSVCPSVCLSVCLSDCLSIHPLHFLVSFSSPLFHYIVHFFHIKNVHCVHDSFIKVEEIIRYSKTENKIENKINTFFV